MTSNPAIPAAPKIYHIVHIDKLPLILAAGGLLSDSVMNQKSNAGTVIGIADIKSRRQALPVGCHPGLSVGQCVPFSFCPRSVMLYVIWKANHPSLAYRGGQGPIIHLEADLHEVIAWAKLNGRQWAFSLSNAGAAYTEFRSDVADLGEINWAAVSAANFQPSEIQHGKQAEFLLRDSFPWSLIRRIGVHSQGIGQQVVLAMASNKHRPPVRIVASWYY